METLISIILSTILAAIIIGSRYSRLTIIGSVRLLNLFNRRTHMKRIKKHIDSEIKKWESLGLIENYDHLKANLVVKRNISDPFRIDVFMKKGKGNPPEKPKPTPVRLIREGTNKLIKKELE